MAEPVLERRFSRRAYDLYQLLEEPLLKSGYNRFEIQSRLDEITKRAAQETESPNNPRSLFYEFFGNVLICAVTRTENHVRVRITDFKKII